MNFETPEGYFRLRLQKRYGNKWHAIGWPTAIELRAALVANLATIEPFLSELVQLSSDREHQPAVCAPARVGDDSGGIRPVPSPAGEARQGDLQTEGPAGEADAFADASSEATSTATPAGPDGAFVLPSGYVLDQPKDNGPTFGRELEQLINRYSLESGSDTPDFILAWYLQSCLESFGHFVMLREKWYGRKPLTDPSNFEIPGAQGL